MGTRLDEGRELNRYLVGLFVFLGLLGTFWGLLQTVHSIGGVIDSMKTGANNATMFDDLKTGLSAPIAGMSVSFTSSLFGLAGSLILGFLDHPPDGAVIPEALAVVNPAQLGCPYPNKNLCGAAVAYKLSQALLDAAAPHTADAAAFRARTRGVLLPSFLKLVAVATVADSVPLTGENRTIAALGLAALAHPVHRPARADATGQDTAGSRTHSNRGRLPAGSQDQCGGPNGYCG